MKFSHAVFPLVTALCLAFGVLLATTIPTDALAQSQPPGGGQMLQQLTLPPPQPPADKPALSIQQADKARATNTTPIPITQIRITGNTLLPTQQLHALVASAEGQSLSLGQLQALAERITQLYHQRGYPLARAYVPAQNVQDGTVTVAVLEARYGRVTLDNTSTTSNRPLTETLAPLATGTPVTQDTLDRTLLLLSDIPGVIVNSTLHPGAAIGTSDLQVDATAAARYSGLVALDDFGNRYTGRARATGTLNVNSLLHQGDKLDIELLSSGSGMSYGQLGYRYLLNGQGTTLGVATSYLHYQLSGSLSDLQAHGTAQVDSINLMHPLIRSTAGNLYVQVQFDHKQLHDDIDAASIRTDRHTNGWTAVVAGDRRDDHGITNFNVSATVGRVTFDNEASQVADHLGADTQGADSHYDLTIARLQQLDQVNALYFAFTGQLADKNLDPADQFYLGGPSNARGYDVGALTGAEGGLVTAEWRRTLAIPWAGKWLGSLFTDRGHIQVYKDAFTPGANDATLSDIGASVHWDGPKEWAVSAQIATRVGPSSPLLRADSGERFWLQAQKGF